MHDGSRKVHVYPKDVDVLISKMVVIMRSGHRYESTPVLSENPEMLNGADTAENFARAMNDEKTFVFCADGIGWVALWIDAIESLEFHGSEEDRPTPPEVEPVKSYSHPADTEWTVDRTVGA